MSPNVGSITSFGTWKKIWFHGAFVMMVLDFFSDIYADIIYWRNKIESSEGLVIPILATISLALGFLVLSLTICLTYCIEKVSQEKENVLIYRLLEATVESIPQLWISLYVLSASNSQENQERIYLYASATFSFLVVVSIFFESDPLSDNESTSRAPLLLKALKTMWTSTLFFGRMTTLAYVSVQLGWWTALFLVIHVVQFSRELKNMESKKLRVIFAVLLFFYLVNIGSPNRTALFFVLFIVQNVAWVLVTYAAFATQPFYLFSNFIAVNMSFHIISVVSFAIYYVIEKCNREHGRSEEQNSAGAVEMGGIAVTNK